MEQEELLEVVRGLRRRRYSPAEIARVLSLSKADAARLVRIVPCEGHSASTVGSKGATNDRAAGSEMQGWISPGWRHWLRIEGHNDWPDDAGAPTDASDSGVALVLVASPDGYNRVAVCGYLVDTWCLGVKNALGPKRMARRDFEALKRVYFAQWASPGIPIPVELAQHLVLGAVEYARLLGFEPTGTSDGRAGSCARGRDRARSRSAATASRTTSMGRTRTRSECWRRSSALSAAAASTTRCRWTSWTSWAGWTTATVTPCR